MMLLKYKNKYLLGWDKIDLAESFYLIEKMIRNNSKSNISYPTVTCVCI